MKPYWHKGFGVDVTLQERLFLAELAKQVNRQFDDPIIINIGVNRGTTLHPLSLHGGRIIGIDIDLSPAIHHKDKLPQIEYIEADSTTYEFKEPVHLVFVDGNHEYKGVKGDILNWQNLIVKKGIIAFHDYDPPKFKWRLEGVAQAVDEFISLDEWEKIDVKDSIVAFRKKE